MSDSDHLIVLTTMPAALEATQLAVTLVEERLAACVSIQPEMESVYRWQGQVEQERERQLVIKTTRDRLAALSERLQELHPYDVPELLVVPVIAGSEAYFAWLRVSTLPAAE